MRRVDAASSFVIDAKRDAARYGLDQAVLNRLDGVNLWNAPAMQAGAEIASIWGAAQVNGLRQSARVAPSSRVGDTDVDPAAAKGASTGAESAVNGLKLNKALASQSQTSEVGTTMAGAGARVPFREAARVAREHGGNASDWVKKSSSSYTARDGATFETHWVENVRTGQRVEVKTKFPGGD
jgi:hypothetical protein